MTIRFDGKTAIVTGAGNGLGRSHALELARRGANVVVNDLGGLVDGTDSNGSMSPAQSVVKEIEDNGGKAIANGASVTDVGQVQDMVEQTLKSFGRVDILINNAGILRDKSFHKVTIEDFRAVVEVHLFGSVICTKAVWEIMREQEYGRVVMTTSGSGMYGNFGQANYGAAKAGISGLMQTLKIEGAKYNIKCNTVAPVALTRMTEELMGEGAKLFDPSSVTPGVVYLCSEDAPTGHIISAGAGVFARIMIQETEGLYLQGDDITVENIAAGYNKVCDIENIQEPKFVGDQSIKIMKLINETN